MHIDSSVTEQDWDSGNVALWSCSSHAVFEHCGLSPALKIYHCVQSLGFEMWVLLSSLITVFAWCLVSLFYMGLCLLSLTYRWNISVLFYICYKIKKRNTTTNHSNCCFPLFFCQFAVLWFTRGAMSSLPSPVLGLTRGLTLMWVHWLFRPCFTQIYLVTPMRVDYKQDQWVLHDR